MPIQLRRYFFFFKMKRIIIKVNQGRNYLFSTATKPIQFLNGVVSLFFGLVYLINGSTLNQLKIYLNFSYIGILWIWWVVLFLGILQLWSIPNVVAITGVLEWVKKQPNISKESY